MRRPRRSGLHVPLFSIRSIGSWGVGEFLDLPVLAEWLKAAGQSVVQILPITEIPDSETSPYSSLTAMALDPIYLSLPAIEDFRALGGESRFLPEDRSTLERIRRSPRIEHDSVRRLKTRWLRLAHAHFVNNEDKVSPRSERFVRFVAEQAWWLDDYALFQAIRDRQWRQPWWEWPGPLARRGANALARARAELSEEISYRQYVQWIAAEQWSAARDRSRPLQVFGDVPFMISADSPDVWTRQKEFRFDATIGVPPDAFSESGQNWGLPPWQAEVMAANDFEWMRQRARRTASLFDGFRLDHLVGLYRTYHRPRDPAVAAFFAPADEASQLALGERLVRIYQETGAEVVAEDLGTIPDFVRDSLRRLGVPGFKVFRWERHWSAPGQPFIDPSHYPEASVATTSTHDTEPLAAWWDSLSIDDRRQVLEIESVKRFLAQAEFIDAMLQSILNAGSRLSIIPIQDVFAWRDRINTPAVVSADNWTWSLPWPVDQLENIEASRQRAEQFAAFTRAAGR